MAKEKFNWKSIFIQEGDSAQAKPPLEKTVSTESKITFPRVKDAGSELVPNEVLGKVVEMYEKGFESLNQSGYDFYEFFKAVMATDPNNGQSYIMAYTMASSMDKSITKNSLVNSGQFYLAEVHKVYAKYNEEGNNLKSGLIQKQKSDKERLQSEIKTIQNKILVLQSELEHNQRNLLNYDSENLGKMQEVEQKIIANNLAKDRIIQKITQVITGITNHI